VSEWGGSEVDRGGLGGREGAPRRQEGARAEPFDGAVRERLGACWARAGRSLELERERAGLSFCRRLVRRRGRVCRQTRFCRRARAGLSVCR